ncbi:hypothetical protein PBRA_008746 [Plasmodiophora brassicae]|uniref:Uncharacterized protein n=1 Tax=Plasmodiophora brassicae TaxID=37360 RepID=A0A0G4J377_PLABS|nr:hypothetical protein PBRA_008746 [Plasmodiophora brassicae]
MLLTPRVLRARKAARMDAASSIPPSDSTSPSSPVPIVDTPAVDHSPEDSDSSVSDSSYDSDHASAGVAKMHATYDAESNISNVDFDVGKALPPDADECLVECSEALAALLKARIPGFVRPSAKPSSGLQQTFFVLDEMCKSSLSDAAFTRMSQVIHSTAKQAKLQCVGEFIAELKSVIPDSPDDQARCTIDSMMDEYRNSARVLERKPPLFTDMRDLRARFDALDLTCPFIEYRYCDEGHVWPAHNVNRVRPPCCRNRTSSCYYLPMLLQIILQWGCRFLAENMNEQLQQYRRTQVHPSHTYNERLLLL